MKRIFYAGDGSNLGKKAKVKVFSSAQDKYLSPYGFSPSNMPKTFDDWSHKLAMSRQVRFLNLWAQAGVTRIHISN